MIILNYASWFRCFYFFTRDQNASIGNYVLSHYLKYVIFEERKSYKLDCTCQYRRGRIPPRSGVRARVSCKMLGPGCSTDKSHRQKNMRTQEKNAQITIIDYSFFVSTRRFKKMHEHFLHNRLTGLQQRS